MRQIVFAVVSAASCGCSRYTVTVSDNGKATDIYPLCSGERRLKDGKRYFMVRGAGQKCWTASEVIEEPEDTNGK